MKFYSQGAILVYDVTNRDSFARIDNWLAELDTYSTNTDIVKMLVGNKVSFFRDFPSSSAHRTSPPWYTAIDIIFVISVRYGSSGSKGC